MERPTFRTTCQNIAGSNLGNARTSMHTLLAGIAVILSKPTVRLLTRSVMDSPVHSRRNIFGCCYCTSSPVAFGMVYTIEIMSTIFITFELLWRTVRRPHGHFSALALSYLDFPISL
ncbi:hypothetical protein B0T12DRAFT_164390 [Alternaria alternata]|nr:hypothetical protein B0T12DRAFT_164390 [Alternaria alternata]